MILLRFRHFGYPDWTSVTCEGEEELLAAENLALSLAEQEHLHVQLAEEGESWEELKDFDFEGLR